MGTDQVIGLDSLVSRARAALGDVVLHDEGGPQECLVRSGELLVLRAAATEARNRLRRWIDRISDVAGVVHIVLRPAERPRCVEVAREIGAAPNHVHFACPIMIGTSRPVIGKRLPPLPSEESGTVGLLDTPLSAPHGAQVAGVLRQHGAVVRHAAVLGADGFGDDLSLARGLREMAADVVLVPSGTYTFDDRCPPVLESALAALRVVAAAGNGGTSRPWWPAAASSVTAVGALDAPFSGSGPWVDAWETGVDVVSAEGHLCTGTSFAAAVHAARLVSRRRST